MRRNASTHKLLSDTEDNVFLEEEENSIGSQTGSCKSDDGAGSDLVIDQNENR